TPTTPAALPVDPSRAPEEVLFLAVVRTFARIALDISVLTDAQKGARADQLLLLFAALTGEVDVLQQLQSRPNPSIVRRAAGRVESRLEERAMSLAGDPAYGIALHNGAVYVDAQVFGRLA